MEQTQTYFYHSHGKLLITGEYAVLDGALSLALPTAKGQSLQATISDNDLVWKAFDADQQLWFDSRPKSGGYTSENTLYSGCS